MNDTNSFSATRARIILCRISPKRPSSSARNWHQPIAWPNPTSVHAFYTVYAHEPAYPQEHASAANAATSPIRWVRKSSSPALRPTASEHYLMAAVFIVDH